VEEEKYCVDIIQSSVIKEVLSGVENIVFEGYLSTRVMEQMKSGEGQTANQREP